MNAPITIRATPPGCGPEPEFLPLSAVAVRLGQPEHLIRRGVKLGLVPLARAGRVGFVRAADLPLIADNLRAAGLIPA